MRVFSGYIFDLDGTLLDSAEVWNKVDEVFLSRRGFAVPEDYADEISIMGFRAAAQYTIKRFGLSESVDAITAEWNETAVKLFSTEVELFDGALEYLKKLKGEGKRLCVATASHNELLVPALKRCGAYELFDDIITIDDVCRGKEFPDIYLEAARRLELKPSECVVFEDARAAIAAARAGGFYTVAVLSDRSKKDIDELKKASDKTIEGFGELL